jgi:4-coumarate--CoA ligase
MFMHQHLKRIVPLDMQRWLGILPLYHAFGQLWNIVMACKYGIPTYVMGKFHFAQFLHQVQTYRITNVVTAPPLLVMLSKRPETANFDITSLGNIVCGGAPLSKELQNDVARRFKISVKQTWGGTELTCSATLTPGGMADTRGAAGMLLPNMECKLLNDEGKEVRIGERGEAYFKGPNICVGYWKNEAATAGAISTDGFYRTGDVAVRDNLGMFYVVDRKKEMIKVDVFQVAPAELEAILLENEFVADAAVVGVKR